MKKRNQTERLLFTSLAAIVLCVVTLAGTTYAWFFATLGSTHNRVETGTMELSLLRQEDNGVYAEVDPERSGELFSLETNGKNWTAGHTEAVFLAVRNQGTIDDIYNVALQADAGRLGSKLSCAAIPLADENEGTQIRRSLETLSTNRQKWDYLTSLAGEKGVRICDGLENAATLLYDQALPGVTEEDSQPTRYFLLALHLSTEATLEDCSTGAEFTLSVLAGQADIASLPGTAFIHDEAELSAALADKSITSLVLRDDVSAGAVTLDRELVLSGPYTLTLNRATLTGRGSLTVDSGAAAVITGGSYAGQLGVRKGGSLTISGGEVRSILVCQEGGKLTVTGGSFSRDPSEYVNRSAYAVAQSETGLYTVSAR